MLTVVDDPGGGEGRGVGSVALPDEIVREGARRMLAAAEAEVAASAAAHAGEVERVAAGGA